MTNRLIIAIDGGGSHGFFSHHILQQLSTLDTVNTDLVVGVSAGAIMGALFASGILSHGPDDGALSHYIARIFGRKTIKGPWFGPTYSGVPKTQALHDIFGDLAFGELKMDMAILVDCVGGDPVVFRSWEPSHACIPLIQILDATSAVPVLFPPVTINQQQYMDGATITNSPISIAHLVGLCRYPQDNISLLSIGTINPPVSEIEQNRKFANSDMGIVQLVALGLPLKIVRQSGFVNNQLSIAILGTRFLRIEGIVTGRTDDVATCTECVEVGRSVWVKSAQAITDFLLQTNLSTTAELGCLVSSDPLDRPATQGGDSP